MSYAEHLRALLEPLGVYTFADGTLSGGEIAAEGKALDEVEDMLALVKREALLPTACSSGLAMMQALFAHAPASPTLSQRRAALAALYQVGGDDFTTAALNRTLCGCGIAAQVEETENAGVVRVTFPDTVGKPENEEALEQIILQILPCHLQVEFYFTYLRWKELEEKFPSFAKIEADNHTWKTLQQAVCI